MNVLIIDDDAGLRKLFAEVVRSLGYPEADVAGSAAEALTHVIRREYSLITLDIQMPGATGLEVLPMVRNMCPHAVIALVSAFVPEELAPETAGCADVILNKPVAVATLRTILDNAARMTEILQETHALSHQMFRSTGETEMVAV